MLFIEFIKEHYPEWAKRHPKTILILTVAIISVVATRTYDSHKIIEPLKDENNSLVAQLIPFKTVALEKYGNLAEDEALGELATRVGQVELCLINLPRYEEVSLWDASGVVHTVMGGGGAVATGPSNIAGWDQDYWKISDAGELTDIECGSDALARYLETINKAPLFPFAQFSMAVCLQREEDDQWRAYFQKTYDILSRTTVIPNHNKDHDSLMQIITRTKKNKLL